MDDDETVRTLREELARVTDERDRLKKTVLQFMAEQFSPKSGPCKESCVNRGNGLLS